MELRDIKYEKTLMLGLIFILMLLSAFFQIYSGFYLSLSLCIVFVIYNFYHTTKIGIPHIISFSIVFYTSTIFLYGFGTFYEGDSWRYFGAVENIIKTSSIPPSEYALGYSTYGFHAVMIVITLITGFHNPQIWLIFTIMCSITPALIVYLLLKEINKKFAYLASFLTILGIEGYWLPFITVPAPNQLALSIFLPLLFYLNYLFLREKSKYIISALHLVFYIFLLLTHLWSTYLYLMYYFVFSLLMLFIAPNRSKFSNIIFYIFSILLFIYLYFVPLSYRAEIRIYHNLIPFVFIGIISTHLIMYYILSKYKYRIENIIRMIANFLSKKNVDNICLIAFSLLIIVAIYFIYLHSPYETEKSYLQVLSTHINLVILAAISWIGFLQILKAKKIQSQYYIILSWIFICGIIFILSFITLHFNIYIIYSWRHLACMSPFIAILISYGMLLSENKIKRIFLTVMTFFLIFFAIISFPLQINETHEHIQEFTSVEWIEKNTQEKSVIASMRLSDLVVGISQRLPLYITESRSLFTNDEKFKCALAKTDYITISSDAFRKGTHFSPTGKQIYPSKLLQKRFEDQYLLNNVYSNHFVEIYANNLK